MLNRLKNSMGLNLDGLSPHEVALLAELFCNLRFDKSEVQQKIHAAVEKLSPNERDEAQIHAACSSVEEIKAEEAADKHQEAVGAILAECYDYGNEELSLARDPWKARKFGRRPPSKAASKPRVPNDTDYRTEDMYANYVWFTRLRLFLLRVNRIFLLADFWSYINRVASASAWWLGNITTAIANNLSRITSIAGLSYGFELLTDLAIMFRGTFFPTKEEEQNMPHWLTRLYNIFIKDERRTRMANAFVWFTVNLVCFFLTSGLSAILNIALFGFDVLVDVYKVHRDKSKRDLFFERLKQKQMILGREISSEKEQLEQKVAQGQNNNEQFKGECEALVTKIHELQKYDQIEKRFNEKQQALLFKRYYAFVITSIIFVGMLLFLFPPAGLAVAFGSLLAVKLLGAGLAMTGSVFAGLGKALYEKAATWWDSRQAAKAPKRPILNEAEIIKLIHVNAPSHSRHSSADLLRNGIPSRLRGSSLLPWLSQPNPLRLTAPDDSDRRELPASPPRSISPRSGSPRSTSVSPVIDSSAGGSPKNNRDVCATLLIGHGHSRSDSAMDSRQEAGQVRAAGFEPVSPADAARASSSGLYGNKVAKPSQPAKPPLSAVPETGSENEDSASPRATAT